MDREKVINGLKELSGFLFKEYGRTQAEEASIYYDRFLAVDNAITLLEDCDTQLQYRDDHIAMYQAEINRLEALLKEQETGHWIFLTDCSNSGVYCSECNTKVFDNYPFKKKFSYFCPHCGTRMEGEVEKR